MKNFNAASIDDLSIAQLAELPPADLAGLDADLDMLEDLHDRRRAKINEAKSRKYSDLAAKARQMAGKDTGTIRLFDGDWQVVCALPKRVKWDQGALRTAFDSLSEEDARHYAKVELKVDERRFDAAPPAVRIILAVARTVETGKPTFTVEPRTANEEAA